MDTQKQIAVVIPIYKIIPSESERKSMEQCLSILGNHSIVFICGLLFDSTYYEKLVINNYKISFLKITFDDKYFGNISGYNDLCLSSDFYNSFADYKYILIYQLDAWVFKDELHYWCNKGYDYIGAPWYDDWGSSANSNDVKLLAVGNGGFSLRKVDKFKELLGSNRKKPLRNLQRFINDNYKRLKKNPLLFFLYVLKSFGYKNNIEYLLEQGKNEDGFFYACSKYGNLLQTPPLLEALKFAFELHPDHSYILNNQQLPFGCHAWQKYEYETFWKKHIKI